MDKVNTDGSRREFLTKAGGTGAAVAIASALGGAAHAEQIELNAVQPTPEQIQQFMQLPDGPVVMVNLLKFKPGGAPAYAKYGEEVSKILSTIGAEIIFSGECKMALLGGATWDSVGLVRYPDKMALMKMAQSPEYQAIHHYREEGLEGQINLAVFENDRLA